MASSDIRRRKCAHAVGSLGDDGTHCPHTPGLSLSLSRLESSLDSEAGGRNLEGEGTVSLSLTVLVPAHFRGHLGLRHSTFSPVLSRLGCHPHPVRDQHVDLEPPLALFFSLSIR